MKNKTLAKISLIREKIQRGTLLDRIIVQVKVLHFRGLTRAKFTICLEDFSLASAVHNDLILSIEDPIKYRFMSGLDYTIAENYATSTYARKNEKFEDPVSSWLCTISIVFVENAAPFPLKPA